MKERETRGEEPRAELTEGQRKTLERLDRQAAATARHYLGVDVATLDPERAGHLAGLLEQQLAKLPSIELGRQELRHGRWDASDDFIDTEFIESRAATSASYESARRPNEPDQDVVREAQDSSAGSSRSLAETHIMVSRMVRTFGSELEEQLEALHDRSSLTQLHLPV